MICEKCKKDVDERFSIQKFFYSKEIEIDDNKNEVQSSNLMIGLDVRYCRECAKEIFQDKDDYKDYVSINYLDEFLEMLQMNYKDLHLVKSSLHQFDFNKSQFNLIQQIRNKIKEVKER